MARPRDFEEERAVDAALKTFWRYGYDGTSLSDLLQSTGVVRSSFYRTFDSKEELFRRCIALYHEKYLGFREEALAAEGVREVLELLLYGLVALHTGEDTPAGCFETNAALTSSPENADLRGQLAANRESLQGPLEKRLSTLSEREPLPHGMSPQRLASFVLTFTQGLAVRANSGATRQELLRDVDFVLDALGFGPDRD